jgi:hypothetical protein
VPGQEEARKKFMADTGKKAFIPERSSFLKGLEQVNAKVLEVLQRWSPEEVATLDQDATLIPTTKKQALYGYKGFQAYQPLNVWWAEQKTLVHTEFRDGNVPAGFEVARVFWEAVELLPTGVSQVRYRGDTASFHPQFLKDMELGKKTDFGRIEFAVSVPVCPAFREAVEATSKEAWQPFYEYTSRGERKSTGLEYVELDYVGGLGTSKKGSYRFLATRELLDEQVLPHVPDAERPFPVLREGTKRYKLHGVVTNLKGSDGWDGEDILVWHRERCGKSEEVHAILKGDLAGGKLPSKRFGANAAWWWMAILAHNLTGILKRVFLGGEWAEKRMKALRFHLVNLPARVAKHARKLTIRLAVRVEEMGDLILEARRKMSERCGFQ